jgi:hypothetical protein
MRWEMLNVGMIQVLNSGQTMAILMNLLASIILAAK